MPKILIVIEEEELGHVAQILLPDHEFATTALCGKLRDHAQLWVESRDNPIGTPGGTVEVQKARYHSTYDVPRPMPAHILGELLYPYMQ